MVKHLMIQNVVTAKVNLTIKDAIKMLQVKHVGSIVITDDGQKCLGIFTERDAIRVIAANEISLNESIDQVMTTNVITIGEEASLEEARQIIVSHRIRHLPVVDPQGELVGLLSVRKISEELFGLTTAKYC
jgi:CBS domain-containing protein